MLIYLNREAREPWAGKTSIYSYIREQGEAIDGSLPDDEAYWAGSKLRWVAGGLDGSLGHHAAVSGELSDGARELVELLAKQSRKPSRRKRAVIYSKLMESNLIGQIDAVLEAVRKHPGMQPGPLFEEALWLAEHGAHRNVVKFGIALLGLYHNESVKELLLTLARHDEFTLYAVVAIRNGMEDSNDVLFELAQQVHGWGKIHVVERLEPSRQDIKDWLLRHGCQNSIMNEYLACICARGGQLHEALSAAHVDDALFEGATDIVQALLSGGPAEDIDDYEHAPQVISDYLRLAREMASSAKHLSVVMDIQDFLSRDEQTWAEREAAGWTEALRLSQLELCRSIAASAFWESRVIEAVESDGPDHGYGVHCARRLGIDIWDRLFAQLEADPLRYSHYSELMSTDDPERLRRLIRFAEEKLPLAQIAAGPAEELGMGPEYAAHRCLSSLLQNLGRHEGLGAGLIAAGLSSPVIPNRNLALAALEAWDIRFWGEALLERARQLAAEEPDDSVKERIVKLMESRGI